MLCKSLNIAHVIHSNDKILLEHSKTKAEHKAINTYKFI